MDIAAFEALSRMAPSTLAALAFAWFLKSITPSTIELFTNLAARIASEKVDHIEQKAALAAGVATLSAAFATLNLRVDALASALGIKESFEEVVKAAQKASADAQEARRSAEVAADKSGRYAVTLPEAPLSERAPLPPRRPTRSDPRQD